MKLLSVLLLGTACTTLPAHAADKPDAVVKRHLEAKGTPYEIDEDNDFSIVVDLGDGRTQMVYVISDTHRSNGIEVREIWSTGYQAPDKKTLPVKVANRLLEHSHDMVLGSWVKQEEGFATFVVKVPADASSSQLDGAIDAAASSADEIEEEFTGDLDEY